MHRTTTARDGILRGQWGLEDIKSPTDIARGLGYQHDITGAGFIAVPTEPTLVEKMLAFDAKFTPQQQFKFGVIYCKEGQVPYAHVRYVDLCFETLFIYL
jgi:hypothetical protein